MVSWGGFGGGTETNRESERNQEYTQCQSRNGWTCYIIFRSDLRQSRCHHRASEGRNEGIKRYLRNDLARGRKVVARTQK